MPRERRSSSLKDPELYDALRGDGSSEEKAARISNAAAARGRSQVGRKGARAADYDERTVPELRARAKELGLTGYSGKKKSELVSMLRNH
ncbi:MAG: Rho termination factor N-terminal domain-containing protein [Actinobacteria bacterium]|nr:Rho termination factor N-terminal domain-containing protein [Actinomycetota bacterium]